MTLSFVKTEALGNDFVLVQDDFGVDAPALARRICDRRRGVGADGLILWRPTAEGAALRIFNQDGSEAECSGNGLRCMAAYLLRKDRVRGAVVRLETVSGLYTLARAGNRWTADMGTPALEPAAIPFNAPAPLDRVVDYPLRVDGATLRITACATGNPHCSLFVEEIDSRTIEAIGPKVESHPAFPNRTNVEFIRVRNRREIEAVFWERGAGRTPASGTGACGAVVASVLNGRTDRRVIVHAEYGDLEVEWSADGRLILTATANVVAEGAYWNEGARDDSTEHD